MIGAPDPMGAPDRAERRPVPLAVDLDGALVGTDLLFESLFVLAKRSPLRLLLVPLWLARGRAFLRRRLTREAAPDVATLPYRADLLAYLDEERRRGTPLTLVTSADEGVAREIARHHAGLFDAVLAGDGAGDAIGEGKRDRLVAAFGARGFDYAGGDPSDRPVWAAARRAILVGPAAALAAGVAAGGTEVGRVFEGRSSGPGVHLEALRPHQWLKNMLVFVPLAAAHRLYEAGPLAQALLAFAAFALCASSAYLLNDLVDLPSDRRHPHKRERPLASGRLPIARAAGLAPLLLACGAAVGLLLPPAFLGTLALYYALTLAYSFRLRDVVILDVLALAGLYTLRVIGGAAAVGVPPSPWLLAFCMFLFFSLAMVKRYAELAVMRGVEGGRAHARAYLLEDGGLLAALGGASGYLSVLVLALYASSETVQGAYDDRHALIWLVCVLLLYWISHMWLMAHRGRMHDDPLVFALRDRVSRVLVALMAAVLFAAAT